MNKEQKFISEAGAIMLELIAVLSLMGLMGVMLFRQIYKRNEELHNIQMASEIRVVKEGFSAWIQANRADLPSIMQSNSCTRNNLNDVVFCDVSALANDVDNFLPDGYLSGEVGNYYKLFLVEFYRGNGVDQILTYYGVVVPQANMLPDTNDSTVWNFRRAARIAMLIGIDGGAYGVGFTAIGADDNISGSMGTWSLSRESGGVYLWGVAGNNSPPVYVAITGIDVFQPEIELPDVKLGLPEHLDLALRDATAYGKFSVGTDSDCYTKNPNNRQATVQPDGTVVFPVDTINDPLTGGSTCIPAFYVEAGDSSGGDPSAGNVYVTNDLRVGHNYGNGKSAMRFDKNGMIVFENAEVVDPQGKGDSVEKNTINYVLDPQYTSVMNDIKIMSRGGAKLSDILPNYILKEQKNGYAWLLKGEELGEADNTISIPSCPDGYKSAAVVIPTRFGRSNIVISSPEASSFDTTIQPANYHDQSDGGNTYSYVVTTNAGKQLYLSHDVKRRYPFEIKIEKDGGNYKVTPSYPETAKSDSIVDENASYDKDNEGGGRPWFDEKIEFTMQTYCVFDETNFDWNGPNVSGNGTAPAEVGATRPAAKVNYNSIKSEVECTQFGGSWAAGVCSAP